MCSALFCLSLLRTLSLCCSALGARIALLRRRSAATAPAATPAAPPVRGREPSSACTSVRAWFSSPSCGFLFLETCCFIPALVCGSSSSLIACCDWIGQDVQREPLPGCGQQLRAVQCQVRLVFERDCVCDVRYGGPFGASQRRVLLDELVSTRPLLHSESLVACVFVLTNPWPCWLRLSPLPCPIRSRFAQRALRVWIRRHRLHGLRRGLLSGHARADLRSVQRAMRHLLWRQPKPVSLPSLHAMLGSVFLLF
jgi:hypothetical protein